MSIEPVTRRKTSLAALWARWHDATRTEPSQTTSVPKPAAKKLTSPVGLQGRPKRRAVTESILQMAPRQPAPTRAAALNGAEAMTRVLSVRKQKRADRNREPAAGGDRPKAGGKTGRK